MYADDETIRRILADCETWAIIGLADNPHRPAYGVARFLQSHGKRIVPVHPKAEVVHGEKGYPTLADIDEAAAGRVVEAGLDMVMDRCPAIEWPVLGPSA